MHLPVRRSIDRAASVAAAVSALGLAAAWPVLAWLVSSEIGAKSGAGVGLARFVLAALVI